MTGYASGQQVVACAPENSAAPAAAHAQATLALELRSVNGRFLDISFRLPDELRGQEAALRALLTRRVARGKLELRAAIQIRQTSAMPDVPVAALQQLSLLQSQILAWLPQAQPLSVADILRLVSTQEVPQQPRTDIAEAILPLAENVLGQFLAAREREGQRLAQLLMERVRALRALLKQAAPLAPQLVQAQKERFLERWNEALGAAAADATTMTAATAPQAAQEKALAEATAFAIRIDVAEELERLAAHLDEIEAVLEKGAEVGKRLEFLIQELHREANTLGSKSALLEMSRISVDMKVLIEQMREQVQNIE
jgi:uncharacterized protein (TIGR00255 family)